MNSAGDGATSVRARPKGPAAHAIQAHCWRLQVSTLRQPVTADETPTGGPDGSRAHRFQAWSGAARPSRAMVRYLQPRGRAQETSRGTGGGRTPAVMDSAEREGPGGSTHGTDALRGKGSSAGAPLGRTAQVPRPVRPGVWARRPVVAAGTRLAHQEHQETLVCS